VNILDRFEHSFERVVEGSVGRLFRSPVQPAEIGLKLERAMFANQVASVDTKIVPNEYSVKMNPRDMVLFADFVPALCRQMETWLTDLASERRVSTIDRIKVDIAADAKVSRRAIRVDAAMADYGSAFAPTSGAGQRTEMFRSTPVSTSQLRVAMLFIAGNRYHLTKDVTTLGRSSENDIVLPSGDVSRRHARFEYANNNLWLVDLNSTNGTKLNDAPVASRVTVSDGDRIMFGTHEGRISFGIERPGLR
jgi:hypothetical protein